MAGEIEEPIRLDFKANSLHSGSISFGRFESEVLCWERRSAFLHNRYLEEVEKCSKPGSVTEKKAYFEAHFRKKGIKCLSFPGNKNETEEIIHTNTQTNSLLFDDSLNGSVSGTEHETEKEVFGTSSSEAQSQLSFGSSNNDDCTKVHHAKLGSLIIKNDVSVVPAGLSRDGNETKKSNNPNPLEAAYSNPTMGPRVSVSQSRRYVSTKASKGSEKLSRKTVDNVQLRSNSERKTLEAPVQGKCQTKRTPKYELGSKAKGVNEKKRGDKESINRRIAWPHSSALQKLSSSVHQSAKRVKPAAFTTKPCRNQDNSRLIFKCKKQAERRKEVEKKMHAKEAEMLKLRARIQAKKEAEIKQLRKSLNFKARPLPSFYNGALCKSNRNKQAFACNDTPTSKYSNTGSRVAKSSRMSSETCRSQAILSRAPQKTRNPPDNTSSCHSTVTSDSSPSSPDAVISKSRPSKAVCVKKEKENNNHTSLSKHKVAHGNKKTYKAKCVSHN